MSDARKLALLLVGILAHMRMKRDPHTGNYVYQMSDKVVLTEQVHDILAALLAKHAD